MIKNNNKPFLKDSPRRVPFLLKTHNLFGGVTNLLGWLFLAVGLLVSAFLLPDFDFKAYIDFRGELVHGDGEIIGQERTNVSINKRDVIGYQYTFKAIDGKEYQGKSYTTQLLESGQRVAIEYPSGRPKRSRIIGASTSSLPIAFVAFFIFPLAGLIFIILGLKRGLKANKLLANGQEAYGKLIQSVRTNTRINKQYVYKMTFSFSALDGRQFQVVEKSHTPEILSDEKEELLLYHPDNPSYAVLFDNLPGNANIDDRGELMPGRRLSGIFSMLLPLIVLIEIGFFLMFI
ncbi:MAG: hypothetical protein IEMM0008_0687 [bacterium]|nr:MAG: hypothetical protein IEMM0008_0687 [bacterium]